MVSSDRSRRAATRLAAMLSGILVLSALLAFTETGARLNEAGNLFTAATNVRVLSMLGIDATLDGTYIHTSTFSVLIVDPCNGLRAWVLLAPACATLATGVGRRVAAIVVLTALLCVFNQARLVVEMLVGTLFPTYFDLVEEVLMRVVFVIFAMAGLLTWADFNRRPLETH